MKVLNKTRSARCVIEKKLEAEAVEYALGAAMMEPDYRIISNEKGYCNKHFSMMFAKPNKLSLALVLETHIDEIIKNLKNSQPHIKNISKKSIFIFAGIKIKSFFLQI